MIRYIKIIIDSNKWLIYLRYPYNVKCFFLYNDHPVVKKERFQTIVNEF